jgi:hypothetical protein
MRHTQGPRERVKETREGGKGEDETHTRSEGESEGK